MKLRIPSFLRSDPLDVLFVTGEEAEEARRSHEAYLAEQTRRRDQRRRNARTEDEFGHCPRCCMRVFTFSEKEKRRYCTKCGWREEAPLMSRGNLKRMSEGGEPL